LLKEAVPGATRIIFLSDPDDAPSGLKLTQDAAPRLGITLTTTDVRHRNDLPQALNAVAKERPDALFAYPNPEFFAWRSEIADFALRNRIPTMHAFREFVDAGGLMSYGANIPQLFSMAADQVAKILQGANPSDLPVRQATRFELVINLKTAKALGITIPPSLLLRADEVIQ
jgi:putative ABC transport system substrate-binding protein